MAVANEVLVAHLLRRTGFGPAPGEVEAAGAYADALEAALAVEDDGTAMPDPEGDDAIPAVAWWLRRMQTSPAPLHDKLVLFWHGHLTSSADKATADMMARQHDLLRRHALGSFRSLLRAVVHDAALLVFLDAAGSQASAPNENLARELLELFTLGRGHYTEDDVKAAARVLAGFTVDWESEAVGVDEEAAHGRPVAVLGTSGVSDADDLVDLICDHPACAPFVAGRLHRFLTGVDPSPDRLAGLAERFRATDLEVRPLVEDILRHPDFVEQRLTRPRYPVEWLLAAHLAMGRELDDDAVWRLDDLGQLPLFPPNVAGWPAGPQWVGPGRQLLRASFAIDGDLDALGIDLGGGPAADRAAAAFRRAGVHEVSSTTVAAVERAARRVSAEEGGDPLVLALVLASPEASLA